MTDIYTLESLPTSWDDNLDWSVKTKVDSRHFAAILQAIFERKTLCKGYVCPYINDAIAAYQSKTHYGLEWLCRIIYDELIDLILGDPFSKSDMGMNFGSLGEGCVCQNFCPPFKQPAYKYNSRSWWYPGEANLPEQGESNSLANPFYFSENINNLLRYKAGLIRPSPEISPYEDINKTNFKLMRWLQETKSHVSSLIRLITQDIHHGGGGNPSIYHFENDRGEETEYHESFYDERFDSLGNKITTHLPPDNVSHIYCSYSSTFPSTFLDKNLPWYEYTCGNVLPPLKFKNCGDFEVDISLHLAGNCTEYIHDYETGGWIEKYSDEFESFGLPFHGYGWNNLGTVKPGSTLTIIPDSYASMDITAHKYYKAYTPYPAEPYSKYFGIFLDAMELYFYTEDGFRF